MVEFNPFEEPEEPLVPTSRPIPLFRPSEAGSSPFAQPLASPDQPDELPLPEALVQSQPAERQQFKSREELDDSQALQQLVRNSVRREIQPLPTQRPTLRG